MLTRVDELDVKVTVWSRDLEYSFDITCDTVEEAEKIARNLLKLAPNLCVTVSHTVLTTFEGV